MNTESDEKPWTPDGLRRLREAVQDENGPASGPCPGSEALVAYAAKASPREETDPVAQHVGACEACAAEVRLLGDAVEFWRSDAGRRRHAEALDRARARLARPAIAAEPPQPAVAPAPPQVRTPPRRRPLPPWLFAVPLAAVLALVVLWPAPPGPGPAPSPELLFEIAGLRAGLRSLRVSGDIRISGGERLLLVTLRPGDSRAVVEVAPLDAPTFSRDVGHVAEREPEGKLLLATLVLVTHSARDADLAKALQPLPEGLFPSIVGVVGRGPDGSWRRLAGKAEPMEDVLLRSLASAEERVHARLPHGSAILGMVAFSAEEEH
ncbi:MAG: hypothetical protein HYZ53_02920 [Planctomycetes bacterium]|nr:hypothetical protein [Planctomycetota bacterium]